MIQNIFKSFFKPRKEETERETPTIAPSKTKVLPIKPRRNFDGYLEVIDFPELDYKGISISILNKGTLLHHKNNENTEERGPAMAMRQKILHDSGWTYAYPKDWALGGKFNVISMEFFEELINSNFQPVYTQTFSGSNVGYITMNKPTKEIYPPEYGAQLPIKRLKYSHHFSGKHMEFTFEARVESNPNLPHYHVHAKEFILSFKVNREDFINALFYNKEVGKKTWNAFEKL